MNEEAWLSTTDINQLIDPFRYAKDKERKFRLFALECVRAIRSHLTDQRSLRALEFTESNVDRRSFKRLRHRPRVLAAAIDAENEAAAARERGQQDMHCPPEAWNNLSLVESARSAARRLLDDSALLSAIVCPVSAENVVAYAAAEPYDFRHLPEPHPSLIAAERHHRMAITWFRDIFGNPFRPVTFSPDWRTSTAVALAKSMYDSRDFSAMPILADALQDAGCDSDDILNHCRDTGGVHVRGCWVVDLVLGKE